MALLGTSNLWPPFNPANIAPMAMPYGMHGRCFEYCPPTGDCGLNYFAPPCQCTFVVPAPAVGGPVERSATLPPHP